MLVSTSLRNIQVNLNRVGVCIISILLSVSLSSKPSENASAPKNLSSFYK